MRTKKAEESSLQAKDLHVGDTVKVLSLNLNGTVSTLPDAKGNLYVQMGILRSQVNITDLELIGRDRHPRARHATRPAAARSSMSKSASVSTEINLLGKTVDEALAELDKYLDDAYLAHIPPGPYRTRKRNRRPAQSRTQLSAPLKNTWTILPPG